jgi:hypothetical protein
VESADAVVLAPIDLLLNEWLSASNAVLALRFAAPDHNFAANEWAHVLKIYISTMHGLAPGGQRTNDNDSAQAARRTRLEERSVNASPPVHSISQFLNLWNQRRLQSSQN